MDHPHNDTARAGELPRFLPPCERTTSVYMCSTSCLLGLFQGHNTPSHYFLQNYQLFLSWIIPLNTQPFISPKTNPQNSPFDSISRCSSWLDLFIRLIFLSIYLIRLTAKLLQYFFKQVLSTSAPIQNPLSSVHRTPFVKVCTVPSSQPTDVLELTILVWAEPHFVAPPQLPWLLDVGVFPRLITWFSLSRIPLSLNLELRVQISISNWLLDIPTWVYQRHNNVSVTRHIFWFYS